MGEKLKEAKNLAILLILEYFKLREMHIWRLMIQINQHFGLGFFGLGWRDGFDTNRFLTANIVPFETDGTFPIEDTTSRVDFGVSFRKDKSIFLNSLAAENGNAEVSINVAGNCTGKDKMKTLAGEFGVGEVGVKLNNTELSWAAEGAYRQAESDYTVTDPTSSTACSDLSTAYSERIEEIKNDEYDWVFSFSLKGKKGKHKRELRARGFLYDRDFKQTLSLDSVAQTGVTSNVSEVKFRPSVGILNKNEKFSYSLAVIQDYHPLKQASLHIDDIAGVATRYEFMNLGGILIRHRLISDIRCQKKQDYMQMLMNLR